MKLSNAKLNQLRSTLRRQNREVEILEDGSVFYYENKQHRGKVNQRKLTLPGKI